MGFRYFAERSARRFGLSGWVRNVSDGSVEIEAEGEEEALNAFLQEVRVGPPCAHVRGVRVDRRPHSGLGSGFEVRF